MALFDSFFMAGFECSTQRRKDGVRLDLIASTAHDAHALSDYRACAELGVRSIRDGLRWHRIETAPGVYDWSSWTPMLAAAAAAGVQVAWDLYHYGSPDFHDPASPAFVDAFARFAGEAARAYGAHSGGPPLFCPVNEMSFFAWAVDNGYFGPRGVNGAAFKRRLVECALAAVEAVRAVAPDARFICAEPLIHIAPRDHGAEERARAEEARLYQFEACDLLLGRAEPELGGRADALDAVGLNFYPHNQWYLDGPTIPMGHHEHRPLADMLVEAWERYGKPIFIAETGAEGSGRPAWLHYVCDEVRAATARGARIEGVCLYPVTAYPGWDNDRHAEVGLFGSVLADGARRPFAPLVEELARQREIFNGL